MAFVYTEVKLLMRKSEETHGNVLRKLPQISRDKGAVRKYAEVKFPHISSIGYFASQNTIVARFARKELVLPLKGKTPRANGPIIQGLAASHFLRYFGVTQSYCLAHQG